MQWGSTTLKGEAWHYPGSYSDTIAYLNGQLDTRNFIDSSGHKSEAVSRRFRTLDQRWSRIN